MTFARGLAVAGAVVLIGLLLFAHAAGVSVEAATAGAFVGLVAAVRWLSAAFRSAPPAPRPEQPARQAAETRERERVQVATTTHDVERQRLAEREAADAREPLGDRAQALIDAEIAERGKSDK